MKAGNRLTETAPPMMPDPRAWQSPSGSTPVRLTTPCGANSHELTISLCAWGTYRDDQDVSLQEYLVCCWCSGAVGSFCNDLRAQAEQRS